MTEGIYLQSLRRNNAPQVRDPVLDMFDASTYDLKKFAAVGVVRPTPPRFPTKLIVYLIFMFYRTVTLGKPTVFGQY